MGWMPGPSRPRPWPRPLRDRDMQVSGRLVRSARLQIALLDPQMRREFRLVPPHVLDETLRVVASDEDVDGIAEREGRRERVIDYRIDEHAVRMTAEACAVETAANEGRKGKARRSGPSLLPHAVCTYEP